MPVYTQTPDCEYTLSYTPTIPTEIDGVVVTFDSNTNEWVLDTIDNDFAGTYTLSLFASADGVDSATLNIPLTIVSSCGVDFVESADDI